MTKSKTLSDLQALIQESVQLRTAPPELLGVILEKPPISIRERLTIYQDAYQIRLLESLRDDFARVEYALGDEDFEKLTLNFIRQNSSHTRNLAEYGEYFPDFIKLHKNDAYALAVTDWLEVLSSHASNPEKQLSSAEIQLGQTFKVQTMPSTLARQIGETRVAVYRSNGAVNQLELTLPLFDLLIFLETERAMDELTYFSQKSHINDEQLAETIQEWIGSHIIYCKPI